MLTMLHLTGQSSWEVLETATGNFPVAGDNLPVYRGGANALPRQGDYVLADIEADVVHNHVRLTVDDTVDRVCVFEGVAELISAASKGKVSLSHRHLWDSERNAVNERYEALVDGFPPYEGVIVAEGKTMKELLDKLLPLWGKLVDD